MDCKEAVADRARHLLVCFNIGSLLVRSCAPCEFRPLPRTFHLSPGDVCQERREPEVIVRRVVGITPSSVHRLMYKSRSLDLVLLMCKGLCLVRERRLQRGREGGLRAAGRLM